MLQSSNTAVFQRTLSKCLRYDSKGFHLSILLFSLILFIELSALFYTQKVTTCKVILKFLPELLQNSGYGRHSEKLASLML